MYTHEHNNSNQHKFIDNMAFRMLKLHITNYNTKLFIKTPHQKAIKAYTETERFSDKKFQKL